MAENLGGETINILVIATILGDQKQRVFHRGGPESGEGGFAFQSVAAAQGGESGAWANSLDDDDIEPYVV